VIFSFVIVVIGKTIESQVVSLPAKKNPARGRSSGPHQFTDLFIHPAITVSINEIVGRKAFLLYFYHVDFAIETIFLNRFIAFSDNPDIGSTRVEARGFV
jgi:hypothetical protein